jgi:small-conductance mechanosensitive channel/uncharacterized protein YndB with AHSA1/START domain
MIFRLGLLCIICLLAAAGPSGAQEKPDFDEIEADDELTSIEAQVEADDIDASFLEDIRPRVVEIEAAASVCSSEATEARTRLEERFEPLKDVDPEIAGSEIMDQRADIRGELDEAISLQSRCQGVDDDATALLARISERQSALSQQFLSSRTFSVISLIKGFPERAASWPSQLRKSIDLPLVKGIDSGGLLWILIIAGVVAAFAGLVIRQRFSTWYNAAGGDSAAPQLIYLMPKPLAEFAPLWIEGAALVIVLMATVENASIDLLVIRVAWAIFIFGIGCVVINWATGPLSPSTQISGLIPDHVQPLRLRLRFLLLTICASFVVLGGQWLSIRLSDPYVSGRASMIFLVAVGLLLVISYLGRIPGLQGRYRPLRYLALLITSLGIIAVFVGYQNFAGFLIHGVTRTGLALFILWILFWLVSVALDYLIQQDTPSTIQIRKSLGVTDKGSRTGLGFMQLMADLILWISFIVYMIYVWDDTGTTLDELYELIVIGKTFGGVEVVPLKIVSGILLFAGIIIVIGWMKRWIDRRWLQHIVIERGARDAIITLFGYVGFIAAVVIALALAGVDLRGLALVSGALALGIGLGMQEIANNFVSGLILLFERPIRAGDFVTVGEVEGFVRSIRIRATEIETLDNQNVLVPNSELVSGRVTNWVLRDTFGRLQVRVGVAYGSNVEQVRDILETVSRDHPEVITDGRAPAPRALFMGFGDSSLDFELRVRIQRIERRFSVVSDLNFAIDAAFRDAGIKIPFPQRDLHIVSYPDQQVPAEAPVDTKTDRPSLAIEPLTRSHREEMETACEIQDVWTALTDIDAINRWLAREGSMSAHIGGPFELALRDGYDISGRIDVFMPPRRLRMALMPMHEEGPLPTGPITIELILRAISGKTFLTVIVAGIPDSEDWEEYYRLSVDRWKNAFVELKRDVLGK